MYIILMVDEVARSDRAGIATREDGDGSHFFKNASPWGIEVAGNG